VVLNIANEDKKLQTPADNTFIRQENLKHICWMEISFFYT